MKLRKSATERQEEAQVVSAEADLVEAALQRAVARLLAELSQPPRLLRPVPPAQERGLPSATAVCATAPRLLQRYAPATSLRCQQRCCRPPLGRACTIVPRAGGTELFRRTDR